MYLLQIDHTGGNIIGYIIVAVVSILLYAAIARSIFRVDTNTRYNKMQVRLLAKIAKHQGVPLDEINEVLGVKARPEMRQSATEISD